MTTLPHTTPEILKASSELMAMYPKLASRITHLRTIFDTIEHYPLNPASVDLWVEDVKSVTTDFLTLTGNARDLIRRILKDQEQL